MTLRLDATDFPTAQIVCSVQYLQYSSVTSICLKAAAGFLTGLMLYVEVTGVSCGRSGGRALLRQRRHDSICQKDPERLF